MEPCSITWSTHHQYALINSRNKWDNSMGTINPFMATDELIGDTVFVWTLFSHTGVYVMAIGLLMPAGLGKFCCCFFWCQPARLVH